MKKREAETQNSAEHYRHSEPRMTRYVEIRPVSVASFELGETFAGNMSSRAAIRAGRFSSLDLGHISKAARHLFHVDSTVLVAPRSDGGPASEISTLCLDDHRVLSTNLFDVAPRYVDAREGIFNSNSRIGEVDLGALEQEIEGENGSRASCGDLERVVVGVNKQGVGKERYEDVAKDGAIERSIRSKSSGVCTGAQQFAELGVAHE